MHDANSKNVDYQGWTLFRWPDESSAMADEIFKTSLVRWSLINAKIICSLFRQFFFEQVSNIEYSDVLCCLEQDSTVYTVGRRWSEMVVSQIGRNRPENPNLIIFLNDLFLALRNCDRRGPRGLLWAEILGLVLNLPSGFKLFRLYHIKIYHIYRIWNFIFGFC